MQIVNELADKADRKDCHLTLKKEVKALVGPATPRTFRRLAIGAGAGAGPWSWPAPSCAFAVARLPLAIFICSSSGEE